MKVVFESYNYDICQMSPHTTELTLQTVPGRTRIVLPTDNISLVRTIVGGLDPLTRLLDLTLTGDIARIDVLGTGNDEVEDRCYFLELAQ